MNLVQIIPHIDPLIGDELPSLGLGTFQSMPIYRRLHEPNNSDDFYCFKTMNGFELGVEVNWLIRYLNRRNKELDNKKIINGNLIIIESIEAGNRSYNYDQLAKRGNAKFGFFYRLVREIPENSSTFWLGLFGYVQVLELIKNDLLIVKETSSQQFLNKISYSTFKVIRPFSNSDYFRIYAGEKVLYEMMTRFY